jgi:hypothetical protein
VSRRSNRYSYSITLSASASSTGGTCSPSVLAVLRLITSSYLAGWAEIGAPGYQSAYLSNLTEKVFSIEIIKPLAERTWALYDSLIARGYGEYKAIAKKHADGYYGWEEEGTFRQGYRHLRDRPHPAASPPAAQAGGGPW